MVKALEDTIHMNTQRGRVSHFIHGVPRKMAHMAPKHIPISIKGLANLNVGRRWTCQLEAGGRATAHHQVHVRIWRHHARRVASVLQHRSTRPQEANDAFKPTPEVLKLLLAPRLGLSTPLGRTCRGRACSQNQRYQFVSCFGVLRVYIDCIPSFCLRWTYQFYIHFTF